MAHIGPKESQKPTFGCGTISALEARQGRNGAQVVPEAHFGFILATFWLHFGFNLASNSLNPFRTRTQHSRMHMVGRWRLPFLATCSDDSKPYMILKALDESYKNHIGFAIIRASGEEQ